MSSLALVLHEQGLNVQGSDIENISLHKEI